MRISEDGFESMYKVRRIIDNLVDLLSEVKELNKEEYQLLISALEYSVNEKESKIWK